MIPRPREVDIHNYRVDVHNYINDELIHFYRRRNRRYVEDIIIPHTSPLLGMFNAARRAYNSIEIVFRPRINRFLRWFGNRLNEDRGFETQVWIGYFCFCKFAGPAIKAVLLSILENAQYLI